MVLLEQKRHDLETDSDSDSSSEGSSLSVKSPAKSRKETPASSQDHDGDVDWADAPMVDEETGQPRAAAASSTGDKPVSL